MAYVVEEVPAASLSFTGSADSDEKDLRAVQFFIRKGYNTEKGVSEAEFDVAIRFFKGRELATSGVISWPRFRRVLWGWVAIRKFLSDPSRVPQGRTVRLLAIEETAACSDCFFNLSIEDLARGSDGQVEAVVVIVAKAPDLQTGVRWRLPLEEGALKDIDRALEGIDTCRRTLEAEPPLLKPSPAKESEAISVEVASELQRVPTRRASLRATDGQGAKGKPRRIGKGFWPDEPGGPAHPTP